MGFFASVEGFFCDGQQRDRHCDNDGYYYYYHYNNNNYYHYYYYYFFFYFYFYFYYYFYYYYYYYYQLVELVPGSAKGGAPFFAISTRRN